MSMMEKRGGGAWARRHRGRPRETPRPRRADRAVQALSGGGSSRAGRSARLPRTQEPAAFIRPENKERDATRHTVRRRLSTPQPAHPLWDPPSGRPDREERDHQRPSG